MALKLRLYKCNICGNIVQVLLDGAGELVCCGEVMELLEAKTVDAGGEKHVPVISNNAEGYSVVKVGSEPHPMTDEHYIQFIETQSNDKSKIYIEFLKPNQEPKIQTSIDVCKALEYCNIHGLWENNND